MGLEPLEALELDLDARFHSLSVFSLPLRSILSHLFSSIDYLFHGSRYGFRKPARKKAGVAAASQLAYLIPRLVECDPTDLCGDARDAQEAYFMADPRGEQGSFIFSYAAFSELMPEARRGYYIVDTRGSHVLTLRHPSTQFSDTETRDIVLNELAKPFSTAYPLRSDDELYDYLARIAPQCDLRLMVEAMKGLYFHYAEHIFEYPLMTEEGFRAAIGATCDDFRRFRAACFAVADYCLGMADAFSRLLDGRSEPEAP